TRGVITSSVATTRPHHDWFRARGIGSMTAVPAASCKAGRLPACKLQRYLANSETALGPLNPRSIVSLPPLIGNFLGPLCNSG
ncbi:hypothetical protein CI102_10917, partial [Trichoderma harzianum]